MMAGSVGSSGRGRTAAVFWLFFISDDGSADLDFEAQQSI